MAREAKLVFRKELPIPFTCSNTTGIEMGGICKMTDPMTCALSDGAVDTFAGIASTEKIASDGKTKIALYRDGIFAMYLSGSCSVGDALVTDSVSNYVKSATALTRYQTSGSRIIGTALETGTTGEIILVEVHPQAQSGG